MQKITIDGREYDIESLSDDAKGQLASIQFVDRELERLQAQIAVLQTARAAYANALSGSLPKMEEGTPFEIRNDPKPSATFKVDETAASEDKPAKKKGFFF